MTLQDKRRVCAIRVARTAHKPATINKAVQLLAATGNVPADVYARSRRKAIEWSKRQRG